jgi:predicted nucleic acid-binding protein
VIVLDAAAAVDLLLERGERGEWVRGIVASRDRVASPHIIEVEVASVLRRLERRAEISTRLGVRALSELTLLPMLRYPTTALLGRVWQLRAALTPYDAAYVALAEALAVPLVTTDARLGRSHSHRAEIAAYPGLT